LQITLGTTAWSESLAELAPWRESQTRQLQVWRWLEPERFCFHYSDLTTFWLRPDTGAIGVIWPETLTQADAVTYLLGPILAFLLRWRGQLCLHGSAIADTAGQVTVFLGRAGMGKSTTAAILAQQGYTVLTDDVVVLRETAGQFWVEAGYPRLRLWPHSTALIYDDAQALPRLVPTHPTWDKQYLDLTQTGLAFADRALPLKQIYCLGARSRQPLSWREPLSLQEAFVQLLANTSVNYLLDREQRSLEFQVLTRLLRQIPCQTLHVTQQREGFAQLAALLKPTLSVV
jgi:hypothetical protein